MKLIVGLGNPGQDYQGTRHNIGFILLDRIVERLGAQWQEKTRFKAWVAEAQIGSEKALFVKPTTYYNLTGESVRAIVDFYKLSAGRDVLVVHDELALPFGTLRTRGGGSDAGNNGIKSVIAHIGPVFSRIRVGIANELAQRQDAADFVLSRLQTAEQGRLDDIAQHARDFVEDFVHEEKEFSSTSVRLPEI